MRDWSKKATAWSLENSFKTLQVDYVDSVLIHGPRHDIEAPLGECFEVVEDRVELRLEACALLIGEA